MKQNSVIKGKWEPTTRGISPFPVTCSLHAIYFLLYDVLGKWNHLTTALILSRQEPFRVSLLFIIHSLVGVAVWEVLFAGVSAGARTSPAGACREVATGCPRDVQDAAFKATLRDKHSSQSWASDVRYNRTISHLLWHIDIWRQQCKHRKWKPPLPSFCVPIPSEHTSSCSLVLSFCSQHKEQRTSLSQESVYIHFN